MSDLDQAAEQLQEPVRRAPDCDDLDVRMDEIAKPTEAEQHLVAAKARLKKLTAEWWALVDGDAEALNKARNADAAAHAAAQDATRAEDRRAMAQTEQKRLARDLDEGAWMREAQLSAAIEEAQDRVATRKAMRSDTLAAPRSRWTVSTGEQRGCGNWTPNTSGWRRR